MSVRGFNKGVGVLVTKKKGMDIVTIEWLDPAFAGPGWMDKETFEQWIKDGIIPSYSVGYLAVDGDVFIVLVQSVGENQVADAIKITKSAIISMQTIGGSGISLEGIESFWTNKTTP